MKVYLDESLKKIETFYPACGSPNSAVKITPQRLYELANAEDRGDVCKAK